MGDLTPENAQPYLARITIYPSDQPGLGELPAVELDIDNRAGDLLLAQTCAAILHEISINKRFPYHMAKALEAPSQYFETSFLTETHRP